MTVAHFPTSCWVLVHDVSTPNGGSYYPGRPQQGGTTVHLVRFGSPARTYCGNTRLRRAPIYVQEPVDCETCLASPTGRALADALITKIERHKKLGDDEPLEVDQPAI